MLSVEPRTPELELSQHLNLIRKAAWKFAWRYAVDFEDLFQDAYLACLQALPYYSPQRGALTTYLWQVSCNALSDLLKKQTRYTMTHDFTDNIEDIATTANEPCASAETLALANERMNAIWNALSDEARQVCTLVLYEEIRATSQSGKYSRKARLPMDKPRKCRTLLRRHLRSRGWSARKIERIFQEIKTVLATTV